MTWWIPLVAAFGAVTLLFLTGIPVFVCFMLIVSVQLFVFLGPSAFGMYINSIYDTSSSLSLTAIPLFILMGEVLFRSNAINVLLNSIDTLIGRVHGRQYLVTLSLSTVLGALSGSGIAVCAMLGRSLLPVMVERGYDRKLAAGTVLSGAMLAPIIPPSIMVIIIGSLADVSIAALLLAGILPGLIMGVAFSSYALLRVYRTRGLAPEEKVARVTTVQRLVAVARMTPFATVIFAVLGLIMLGIATPSESAAAGVFAAVLVAAFYRRLTFRMFYQCLVETAKLTSVITMIMASAILFGQLLAYSGSTQDFVKFTSSLDLSPPLMFFLMMLVPFILCMFLDQIGLMLILIPVYAPIIKVLQFDPIWFYTQFLINITLGAITPPFGYLLFTLASAAPALRVTEIYKAVWPFVWITLGCMAVFFFVPDVVTILPRSFK